MNGRHLVRIAIGGLFLAVLGSLALPDRSRADTGGRFLVPELPGTATITIDDETATTCSSADWPSGAGEVLSFSIAPIGTGPSGSGKLVIRHPDSLVDDEQLYVFLAVNDATTNSTSPTMDNVVLMFDLSHDHAVADTSSFAASDDRGIRFNRDGSVERIYGQVLTPSVGGGSLPEDRECVSEAGPGVWAVEARILPSDLGLNGFNSLMGAAVVATNNPGSPTRGVWPTGATSIPGTWANVITRPPIDYILLIDQSGSMTGVKWASARQAGDNFALILSHLRDDELDAEYPLLAAPMQGDRLGLASFTWTGGPAYASSLINLTAIPNNPSNYISGALPATPGGSTPMIGGVNHTFTMFGGAANLPNPPPRTRVVMLLSDGKHNTPTTTINLSPGMGFDYVPSPCGANSLVRINTVAVGTDATVNTTSLSKVKDCFAGKTFTDPNDTAVNIYNITGGGGFTGPQLTAQLTRFFIQTLEPYYRWNIINTTGADFSLSAGERRLLLFAFWADAGSAVNLSINTPSGVQNGSSNTTVGYSWLQIDNPPDGAYTNFQAPGSSMRLVLVDLQLEARFGIDNRPHGTSSTITLRARLREAGEPVTGANVEVDVGKPEEGFGTVASTVEPKTCNQIEPQLPSLEGLAGAPVGMVGLVSGLEVGPLVTGAVTTPPQGSADSEPSHFSLMAAILEGCGKDDLDRSEEPDLKLFDDGTHGDTAADDGIYTLIYENTEIEGSYVFKFRAEGTTSVGVSFTREREVAEYIRVDIDPQQSPTGSRIIQSANGFVWAEYNVLPRDGSGEYLGPGHADQVDFLSIGGQWISPVLDYNSGFYARIMVYPEVLGEPAVTVVVQGKPIGPPGPLIDLPWWLCLLLLLMVIVLLILLILCWRRYRRLRQRMTA